MTDGIANSIICIVLTFLKVGNFVVSVILSTFAPAKISRPCPRQGFILQTEVLLTGIGPNANCRRTKPQGRPRHRQSVATVRR